MFRLRLVPDNTKIQFMKGRHAGLILSAVLSFMSCVLFFYPGLNLGIDFRGGIVIEARTEGPADFTRIRTVMHDLDMGQAALQEFGSPQDVLIRLERQPGDDHAQQLAADKVRATLSEQIPGTTVRRVEAVGASVSSELFANGMLALGLALVAMLIYIWFRFEWQFGVGAVVTLILDITKIIGFYVVTGMQFNLVAIAAILTILGYSVNDKVVVYDRMRENLRLYKKMPLRELIDRSINETLNRTLGTSLSTLASIIPLALFGGEALAEFGLVLIFGIFLATSSSVFIAAPILLLLGEHNLRRPAPADAGNTEAATPG